MSECIKGWISAAKFGVVFRLRATTAVVARRKRAKPTRTLLPLHSWAETKRQHCARTLCVVVTSSWSRLCGLAGFCNIQSIWRGCQKFSNFKLVSIEFLRLKNKHNLLRSRYTFFIRSFLFICKFSIFICPIFIKLCVER